MCDNNKAPLVTVIWPPKPQSSHYKSKHYPMDSPLINIVEIARYLVYCSKAYTHSGPA